jgi:hypothetical protein
LQYYQEEYSFGTGNEPVKEYSDNWNNEWQADE